MVAELLRQLEPVLGHQGGVSQVAAVLCACVELNGVLGRVKAAGNRLAGKEPTKKDKSLFYEKRNKTGHLEGHLATGLVVGCSGVSST